MKSAISGSHGFLGSHLVKALQDSGPVVPITQELLYQPNELKKFFDREQPDMIFHLAAYGNHANQTDEAMTVFSNVIGTYNMLQASNHLKYTVFVNFSSSAVFFPNETFYTASKKGAQAIAEAFRQKYNQPIVNVFPYSIFGEGEASFRFIPTVCQALIHDREFELDPTPVHDWVYVEDFTSILLNKMLKGNPVILIGTGKGYSNLDVVQLLEVVSGKKAKYKIKEGMRSWDTTDWIAPKNENQFTPMHKSLEKVYEYEKSRA